MKWVYKVSLGFFFVLNGVLLGQNVGIGTAVPGSKLSVAGNLSVGVGYAGTAAPANGAIIEGNVGIGTTAPRAKLDINNTVVVGTGPVSGAITGAQDGTLELSGATNHLSIIKRGLASWPATPVDGDKWAIDNIGGTLGFWTISGHKAVIQPSGNVGIGTTIPSQKLQVEGSGGVVSAIVVNTGDATIGLDVSDGSVERRAIISWQGTGGNVPLTFRSGVIWDGDRANTGTEVMRITATGNVGIGTTTPAEKLDVVGNVQFSGALMPGGNAGTAGQVLTSQGAGSAPTWTSVGAGVSICATASANYLQKWTGSELCNSIVYDDGAKVGIGTTSPGAKVHISGNGYTATDTLFMVQNDKDGTPDSVLAMTKGGNVGIGTTAPGAKLHIIASDTTTVPFQVDVGVMGSKYRIPITIDNTANSNALTDYQILVILDTQTLISAGKMKNDCGDIRFTDSDGTTQLNYWIESGCNSASTRIWVKVPSIPASSTKTIYVYYGNPSAISQSNATATMNFYDDFSSDPSTRWEIYRLSADPSNEFYWDSGSGVVYLTRNVSNKASFSFMNYNGMLNTGFHLRFKYLAGGGSGADGFAFGFYKEKGPYQLYGACGGGGSFGLDAFDGTLGRQSKGYDVEFDNYQNSEPSSNHIAITETFSSLDVSNNLHYGFFNTAATEDNVWHSVEIYFDRTTNHIIVYLDNVKIIDFTGSPFSAYGYAYDGFGFGAGTGGLNNNHVIDDVILRKYTSPEPIISLGAEETVSETVFYIQNKTGNVGIGTTTPCEKLEVIGNAKATGHVTACSDIRFKKDITPLTNALKNVMKLKGVYFRWRTDEFPEKNFSSRRDIGIIAQELEKVYPELVHTDNEGYKSVDYSRLTPILIEAIKELNAKNKELETKIKELEAKDKELEAKNKEIEQLKAEVKEIKALVGVRAEK